MRSRSFRRVSKRESKWIPYRQFPFCQVRTGVATRMGTAFFCLRGAGSACGKHHDHTNTKTNTKIKKFFSKTTSIENRKRNTFCFSRHFFWFLCWCWFWCWSWCFPQAEPAPRRHFEKVPFWWPPQCEPDRMGPNLPY